MRVKDVMTAPAIAIAAQADLAEAIDLLCEHRISGLLVLDDYGRLCGVLSEGDLMRRVELGTAERRANWLTRFFDVENSAEAYCVSRGRKVRDVMSPAPVTVNPDAPLAEARHLMEKHRFKRLPVVRDGQIVGIISRSDFVKALRHIITTPQHEALRSDEEIKDALLEELHRQPWTNNCNFKISVDFGCVRLFGTVYNDDQRRAARVAAETTPGVHRVEEHLEVLAEPVTPGV